MLDDFSISAQRDLKKLKSEHRRLFQKERTRFLDALGNLDSTDRPTNLPKKFRIKQLRNTDGIWSMTWSFSRPDGRATFHIQEIDGQLTIVWRRIGSHEVFKQP